MRLNDRIAGIRDTLQEMGDYLSDIDEATEKSYKNTEISLSSEESKKNPYGNSSSEMNKQCTRLKLLLDSEIDKNHMLEMRICHKDEVLIEITSLQKELYGNIEELSNSNMKLNSELEEITGKFLNLKSEFDQREREIPASREKELFQEIGKLNQKVIELESTRSENEDNRLYALLVKKDKELDALKIESMSLARTLDEFREKQERTETKTTKQVTGQTKTLETSRSLTGFTRIPTKKTNAVLTQLKELLNARDVSEIYRMVSHLYIQHTKEKAARNFVKSISNYMIDLAPADTYKRRPTYKHIWKWISSTAENYRILKNSGGKQIRKLEKLFQVPTDELYSTAKRLLSTMKSY